MVLVWGYFCCFQDLMVTDLGVRHLWNITTLPCTCTHPPSLAVSCAGPSTRVCTDMVVLRGIHSRRRPLHPLILDVGAFGMHKVHGVHHSGGEPLGAGDMTFGACIPSPPRTECSCSHSRSHPCAGVHGWHVADVCHTRHHYASVG
jgi:hypothetical protein